MVTIDPRPPKPLCQADPNAPDWIRTSDLRFRSPTLGLGCKAYRAINPDLGAKREGRREGTVTETFREAGDPTTEAPALK